MMPRASVVALVLVGAAVGACEPAPGTVEWQGHVLQEVRAVSQLPAALRSSLGVDRPGLEGVADRGRPFNITDVVDRRLPMRRFVVAGHEGDTWIVAIEHGGRAYSVEVLLFTAGNPAPQRWVLNDRPNTLAELVNNISRSPGS